MSTIEIGSVVLMFCLNLAIGYCVCCHCPHSLECQKVHVTTIAWNNASRYHCYVELPLGRMAPQSRLTFPATAMSTSMYVWMCIHPILPSVCGPLSAF